MDTVNGLPAHVLLVHAVVILLPLACLALVLHAAWPTARRRLGVVTPALALVSLVLVPVTAEAGEFLQHRPRFETDPLVQEHAELGDQLLPFAVGLFVVAVAVWVLGRYNDGAAVPVIFERSTTARTAPTWLTLVASIVSLAIAVLTVVWVLRIGDSGAQAAWKDNF